MATRCGRYQEIVLLMNRIALLDHWKHLSETLLIGNVFNTFEVLNDSQWVQYNMSTV